VLPASPKYVIDRVIGPHRPELLLPLALVAGGATLVQAVTGFGLSQILGVAAQRAITDMRRTVQAYVLRLPVSYFDSTKSGILISRIMSDAEVTGRLAETLGGIRIVKAYHAERSERLVFTRGANTLFRNIAATMTGISGVGSFATIIIGAIGILMILEGGRSVLSGAMTLG